MSKVKSFVISLIMAVSTVLTYISAPTILTAGMLAFTDTADAAECTLYETLHPNFPLTGSHLSTGKCGTCTSCHAGGIYLGTPKICATCHNGSPIGQISSATIGKSTAHIPIGTAGCDSCHNTTSFTATWSMNHLSVSSQRCDSCHNGSFTKYGAMGKDSGHIQTTADCGTCHVYKDTSTHANDAWSMSIADIHRGITTGCVNCHNGTTAKGKINYTPGHPNTSDACETCHSINNSFKCAFNIDLMKKISDQLFASIRKRKLSQI